MVHTSPDSSRVIPGRILSTNRDGSLVKYSRVRMNTRVSMTERRAAYLRVKDFCDFLEGDFLSIRESYVAIIAKFCRMQVLPLNWYLSVFFEIGICLGKRTRSEKSPICRKWTRMRRSQDEMLRAVDEGFFRDRIGSPEDEYDPFPSLRYGAYRSIGEVFPSFSLVRCWFSLAYGQHSIQEEDTLLRPVGEIGMSSFYTEIRVKFFEYISEAWLHLASVWHREGESHSRS